MNCLEVKLIISLHIDGALSKREGAALAEHVAACAACARELALQEKLSGALRALGREEVQAPAELCGKVMGKLRAERRTLFPRLPAAWRKAVAAAAAVLLIAGGSAGVTAGLKMAGSGKMVGYETSAPQVDNGAGNGSQTSNPSHSGQGTTAPTTGGANAPGDTGRASAPESAGGNATNPANNSGNVNIAPKTGAGAIGMTTDAAAPSVDETRVLLSSGLKVTSTILKLAVSDLNDARIKAVALATGVGAATQVFPEQGGGKKIVVVRLTVSPDRTPGLIDGLTRLGTLLDRQDESRDITPLYNETLVQYRDLQSRKSMSQDTEDQRQLETQAASAKQQLDTWDAEAGKRVIMLWLEGR